MTVRGVALAFLCAVFIASFGYINDAVLYLESFTNGSLLPIIVIGSLVFFVLCVNPLLCMLGRGISLRASELALIVAIGSAACSIPGRGLLEQFTHSMVMPFHWERVTPGWRQKQILSYAPEGTLVTLPEESAADHAVEYDRIVTGYMMGAPKSVEDNRPLGESLRMSFKRVPWDAWRAPLATWLPLVLLSGLASVCLALITYRQWSSHEFLSFPISDFTSHLVEREEGRLLPVVCRSRLFWIGLGILLMIRVNNGLCAWFPEYYIPVRLQWSLAPFAKVWPQLFRVPYGWGLLNFRFFPLVVAFAFFLSGEISLTLGLSQLCWVFFAFPLVTMGMDLNTDWVGGWQGWQRAGAYIMMFVFLLYTGRHYYGRLLVNAFRFKLLRGVDSASVWAMRLLIVSFVAMIVLITRIGLELPFSIITVTLMLMTFVVVSRISAETGLFFIQPRWTIFGLLAAGLGSYAFPPSAQIICGLVCVMLCIDQCQALMPYVTNGLKLCERSKLSVSKVSAVTWITISVATLLAVAVLLIATYEWGAPQNMDWSYKRLPTMAFRTALPEVMQLEAVGALEEAESLPWWNRLSRIAPRQNFVGAFVFGILGVLLFSYLRLRVTWWPLHPVMFLLWATYPMEQTCHAFFCGWLIKTCAIRFGGIRMARDLKPLMVGVIAGELLSAIIFMVVGAVYYMWTGDMPIVYRWFPR
jgi:hypothetical protein